MGVSWDAGRAVLSARALAGLPRFSPSTGTAHTSLCICAAPAPLARPLMHAARETLFLSYIYLGVCLAWRPARVAFSSFASVCAPPCALME